MTRLILDPCCGSKMFWFNKNNDNVIFGDIRKEEHILCDGRTLTIDPDILLDYTALPFGDNKFTIVVYDPPHLIHAGDNGWQALKYGKLKYGWPEDIKCGFSECFRVLQCGGTLIFKWNETQVKVSELLALTEHTPLFGHKSGKNSKTHWICFIKDNKNEPTD